MKGKKLLTALLTLAMGVSTAVGLAGCNKSYNSEETDALLAQLQTTIDGNKTELNGKIAALEQAYKAKDDELQASILANTQALATLKTEYESKVAELEEADKDNATALATLKADYENKVADLQGKIDTANKTIADNKTALETAIATLKATYDEKLDEVEALIDTIQSTDTTQDEKIVALQQQAADLITRLAEMEKATTIVSVAFNDDGDLVITFADGSTQIAQAPQTHVHSFGDWVSYNQIVIQPHCENRLFYRVCSSCYQIEWKQGAYTDHNWEVVTTAPTCQAQGYNTNTCTICGKVEVDNYTPIADHAWSEEYSFDNSYHWYDCDTCDEIKDKTEHDVLSTGECSICNALVGATEGVLYDISADGTYAEVIGYEGTATRVRIADTYENLPVKVIYGKAFYQNKSIVSVVIPDSVETISDSAFSGCSRLTSVVIGDSVTTIGDYAFYYCSSLTSVEIPDSVTSIGFYAFFDCNRLTSLEIPDSVTSIGNGAFAYCGKLQYNVYDNCNYLGNENNPYLALIAPVNKNLSQCTIHEDTKLIADYAFSNCARLTSVEIPDSVETIGAHAFYYCSSLTSVVIPNSVTSIGDGAFYNCSSLTSVVIPDSVTTIGEDAFGGCGSLTSVIIPDSVMTIGEWAFGYCKSLTSVYYKGTTREWNLIQFGDYGNLSLTDATRYYYVENQEDVPTDGRNYWHYNENGEIAIW